MNRNNFDFLKAMFVSCNFEELNILIINQTTENQLLVSDFLNVRVINSFEKGLSKSRNLGLKNATKDILVIADDDVVYKSDFITTIILAFNTLNAQVIQFQIENFSNILFKNYKNRNKLKCTSFDCFSMMSIELVFEHKFLIENDIKYDEKFGLGSEHQFGEENILLHDILKKDGIISYYPITIAQHKNETSTSNLINVEKYYHLGAFYKRSNEKRYWKNLSLKLIFDLKQSKVKLKEILSLLRLAKKGKLDYEKNYRSL